MRLVAAACAWPFIGLVSSLKKLLKMVRQRELAMAYYYANTAHCRQAARDRAKRVRAENPDHVRALDNARYRRNPQKRIACSAAAAKKKPERVKASKARTYQKHKKKWQAWNRQRDVRERNAVGKFTPQDVEWLFKEQRGRCAYCGRSIDAAYHIDHKTPLSRGGTNWPNNLAR